MDVRLEAFEGPLDLLLHLIDKNKVDIYDIPIAEITAQYLEYIAQMPQDLDTMSEFLVMAATLLDIKARMLLPAEPTEEEEEIDPRAELVELLLEHKMFKYISFLLKDRQLDGSKRLYRGSIIPEEVAGYEEPVDLDELTKDVTLDRLHEIYLSVIQKQNSKIDPIRSRFGEIKKDAVSLEDRTRQLSDYARSHKKFSFRNLLEKNRDKTDVIVTFLAILELMKNGTITVSQERLFDDIMIESNVVGQKGEDNDES